MKPSKEDEARIKARLQTIKHSRDLPVLVEWLEHRCQVLAAQVVWCSQPNLTPTLQGRAQEANTIVEELKELLK